MEIRNNPIVINNQNNAENETKVHSPSFRSAVPAMNAIGGIMQRIENGGFLVSFLIQDFLGMTVPRTWAGFLRDKEVTGEYNAQEGFEVLGREGMTGPCMMAVAPAGLYIAAKCGKSTGVNSQLIKRFGNSLKEIVADNNFDRSVLGNPKQFKQDFYTKNIRQILEQTVGKENVKDDSVKYILQQIDHYENIPSRIKLPIIRGKSIYRDHCLNNIRKHIDKIKYATSSDLDMLEKVKFGSEKLKDSKAFSTKRTFEAMIKYADDAITANKHIDKLNEAAAESIKNNALGKRIITTASLIAATLTVLSILPKIYARNNVAPGARKNTDQTENQNTKENVSFKGKTTSFIEKLGKLLDKNKSDFVSSELEYNGHNFTSTLMAGLSLFGLLTPRGMRAYNRAQTDENGKKDLTELWEILLRDVTSSLAVVFAVPMLTRAFVTSYENKSGYVLMQKDRNMNKWKTFLDIINPYSKTHVLTNSEISSLYDGVNSKEKFLNFCKYIDKNGGDLEKILSKSEEASKIFTDETLNLAKLKGQVKTEKNKQIIDFVENFEKHAKKISKSADKNEPNRLIKNLIKGAKPGKNNITKFAKGLNSVPAFIATIFISPYLLGWVIPRLTYKNTRRIHAKEDKEREQKLKTSA